LTIYVSSLEDMPAMVQRFGVRYLVSVIQPDAQPPTPGELDPVLHYRCPVDDIVEPKPGQIVPEEVHVRGLIEFLSAWDGKTPLLTHCHAGISRSSAAALIAHVLQTGDPACSANALRAASPHAHPNRRIVALADAILGFGGGLVEAREAMGTPIWLSDPDYVKEPGRYTTLRV